MRRRSFLELGAVGTGLFFAGESTRAGFASAQVPRLAIPTVDRLVLTSTIDGRYEAVLPSGRLGNKRWLGARGTLDSDTSLQM